MEKLEYEVGDIVRLKKQHRNILIIKACVQDRFRAGQRIIAYAVDLGIVPAAAGGVCSAVGIGAGEVESGGLPVYLNIICLLYTSDLHGVVGDLQRDV